MRTLVASSILRLFWEETCSRISEMVARYTDALWARSGRRESQAKGDKGIVSYVFDSGQASIEEARGVRGKGEWGVWRALQVQ